MKARKPDAVVPVPVKRDEKGRIVAGSLNAGGQTDVQRQARDALNLWLCAEPQLVKGKEAYLRLLDEGNPVIVKDYMDRVAGKVKEHVEVSGDSARPMALSLLTRDELLTIAKGDKPE